MKILFICTGNTCRSVMAQHLLQKMVEAKGIRGWEVQSCGTASEESYTIPSSVKDLLAKEGIANFHHTPKRLDREILEWANLILTMSPIHQGTLKLYYPESLAKAELLTAHAGMEDAEVPDPIGKSKEVYGQCLELICTALSKILEKDAKP